MKIDHIERPDGRIAIARGRRLHPAGSPPMTVAELIFHDDDTVHLYAKDAERLGVYFIAPGDLVVYAVTHDGLPEDSEGDDHGE